MGPFYRAMLRSGNPISCVIELEDGRATVTYVFPGPLRLVGSVNNSAESSEQRAEFGGIQEPKALELLRAAEKVSYSPDGCGIAWDLPSEKSPSPGGSVEAIYRGDSCNCQARLTYRNSLVVKLVLKSAC